MNILIFEYITGGGLVGEVLPSSLLSEGELMLNAVAKDFSEMTDVQVSVMRDYRLQRNSYVGDEYVVTGSKMWITNGGVADYYIIFARTNPELTHKGVSAFILQKGDPGFEIGAPEKKLGIKASMTTPLTFDECRIPASRILGNEGDGFKIAMTTLAGGRLGIASQAIGIGQASIDAAVAYSKTRMAFGKPIGRFQGLRWMIADAAMEIERVVFTV